MKAKNMLFKCKDQQIYNRSPYKVGHNHYIQKSAIIHLMCFSFDLYQYLYTLIVLGSPTFSKVPGCKCVHSCKTVQFFHVYLFTNTYMRRLLCYDHISNFYTLWPFKNFKITLVTLGSIQYIRTTYIQQYLLIHKKISALGTDFVHIKITLQCQFLLLGRTCTMS